MSKFSETIKYNGEELEVSGNSWPFHAGARERGPGLQLEPDEEAGFEVEEIIYKGVDVFSLMDNSMDEINEQLEKKWREL
jgi:hypothetical protein